MQSEYVDAKGKPIELGDEAKDLVTQMKGVVTAKTEFLNGCKRVLLQPRELKDGHPLKSESFDVEQIEVTKAGAMRRMKPSGGPMPEPTRAAGPTR